MLYGLTTMIDSIREYWNKNINDIEIAKYPIGTREFFDNLETYHFEKLEYLPRIVSFNGYKGKRLLEVGCGLGIDLVHFAKGGAKVYGIDVAEKAIKLAEKNFELHGVNGELHIMNGEDIKFNDNSFDFVYAHGVLAYTENPEKMISEIHRVLKTGGETILMMYNRSSWLFILTKLFGVKLEREDAAVFNTYSINEFRQMSRCFSHVDIITERLPVRTRIHKGMKATLYNSLFVPVFNLIPRPIVRLFGAHIIAKCIK